MCERLLFRVYLLIVLQFPSVIIFFAIITAESMFSGKVTSSPTPRGSTKSRHKLIMLHIDLAK